MQARLPGLAFTACLALLLVACQPTREAPPPSPVLPVWPGYDYPGARTRGLPVYTLDPARSRIEVVVGRDGPLARFGHDHVIVVGDPQGFLQLAGKGVAARADLRFAVTDLQVDPAQARQRHGMDSQPSAADIAGTRENLLRHVLDPQRWPWVEVAVSDFTAQGETVTAQVAIDINGRRYTGREGFRLNLEGGSVLVTGYFRLRQSELGLTPFSALGGGLRVADEMDVWVWLCGRPPS